MTTKPTDAPTCDIGRVASACDEMRVLADEVRQAGRHAANAPLQELAAELRDHATMALDKVAELRRTIGEYGAAMLADEYTENFPDEIDELQHLIQQAFDNAGSTHCEITREFIRL